MVAQANAFAWPRFSRCAARFLIARGLGTSITDSLCSQQLNTYCGHYARGSRNRPRIPRVVVEFILRLLWNGVYLQERSELRQHRELPRRAKRAYAPSRITSSASTNSTGRSSGRSNLALVICLNNTSRGGTADALDARGFERGRRSRRAGSYFVFHDRRGSDPTGDRAAAASSMGGKRGRSVRRLPWPDESRADRRMAGQRPWTERRQLLRLPSRSSGRSGCLRAQWCDHRRHRLSQRLREVSSEASGRAEGQPSRQGRANSGLAR
jgi:hypothetical protein